MAKADKPNTESDHGFDLRTKIDVHKVILHTEGLIYTEKHDYTRRIAQSTRTRCSTEHCTNGVK